MNPHLKRSIAMDHVVLSHGGGHWDLVTQHRVLHEVITQRYSHAKVTATHCDQRDAQITWVAHWVSGLCTERRVECRYPMTGKAVYNGSADRHTSFSTSLSTRSTVNLCDYFEMSAKTTAVFRQPSVISCCFTWFLREVAAGKDRS